MKPNSVGSKVLYLNPARDVLTTANLAAIDGAIDYASVSPYAYTATVRDDYDAYEFHTSNPGAPGGSDLAIGQRVAFGLFLSPQNDNGNLLFQVSGRAYFQAFGTSLQTNGAFFFGRKATNNTVVSDKTSVQNTLAKWTMLPNSAEINPYVGGSAFNVISAGIQTEIFTAELTGGYVYCFGYLLDNASSTNACTLRGSVSLAFRKYTSTISTFRPKGS